MDLAASSTVTQAEGPQLPSGRALLIAQKQGQQIARAEATATKQELYFGELVGDPVQQAGGTWYTPTDWGDVKLVSLTEQQDSTASIVLKITGWTPQRSREQGDTYTVYAFRMPCDVTETYPNEYELQNTTQRTTITLTKVAEGNHAEEGYVVFFENKTVSLDGEGSAIPGTVQMGDDGVKEIACADFFPVGMQKPADLEDLGTLVDPELECDSLRYGLVNLASYVSRGVAHPESASIRDYDGQKVRKLDDKGGRRWGRPILNREFMASAGVEKLVITIHAPGKDGGAWKEPGRSGDGVDHILFRNPADIFYVTGYGGHVGWRYYGTTDASKSLVICPTASDRDYAVQHDGVLLERTVVLDTRWADSTEVEWYAVNNNFHLFEESAMLDSYQRLCMNRKMHGVLGFAEAAWSGTLLSEDWTSQPGSSIVGKWIAAMRVDGGQGWTVPAATWLFETAGAGHDWRKETFDGLADTDGGQPEEGWGSGFMRWTPPQPPE